MEFTGARYIQILVPCPLGWGTDPKDTIRIARLAEQCGMFPLFEAEYGVVTKSTPIRRRVAVDEYLQAQKRFAHLFKGGKRAEQTIAMLQRIADRNIARYDLLRPLESAND